MNLNQQKQAPIDAGGVVFGVILGMLVGGVVALFKAPRLRVRHQPRKPIIPAPEPPAVKALPTLPTDPVEESRTQAIAAARRRRFELGV